MSITARRQLRQAVVAACETIVGVTVRSPGNWDSEPVNMPEVLIRCGDDRKVSNARGPAVMTTTVTIEIFARVTAPTDVLAQDGIEALSESIEESVLASDALQRIVQQFTTVVTRTTISTEGAQPLAGIQMSIECEVFEVFDTTVINPVQPALEIVAVHLDTVEPFDATGTYADPPFPDSVLPAPRTSGPDGRDEGALLINLPQ